MSRAWMPLYIGDFLADTMHLGATERGIYISLIMHAWQHDGTIPLDDRKLAKISGCDSRLWHLYRTTALQFFEIVQPQCSTVEPSTAQHLRVVKELRRSDEISSKRKAAAEQMLSKRAANAQHLHTQSPSQSHLQKQEEESRARKRASRLPENWMPSPQGGEFAISHGLSQAEANTELKKFTNYWTAKAGQGATKLEWGATWENWILTATERKGKPNGHRKQSLGDLAADLADEIREREFAEGIGRPPHAV